MLDSPMFVSDDDDQGGGSPAPGDATAQPPQPQAQQPPQPPATGVAGWPIVNTDEADIPLSDSWSGRNKALPGEPLTVAQKTAHDAYLAAGYYAPTSKPGSLANPMTQGRENYRIGYGGPDGTYYWDYKTGALRRAGDPDPTTTYQGRTGLQDAGAGFMQGLRDIPDHTTIPAAQWIDQSLPGVGSHLLTGDVPADWLARQDAAAKREYMLTSGGEDEGKFGRFAGQQTVLLPVTAATEGAGGALADGLEAAAPSLGRAVAPGLRFVVGQAKPVEGLGEVGNSALQAASRFTAGSLESYGGAKALGEDPSLGDLVRGGVLSMIPTGRLIGDTMTPPYYAGAATAKVVPKVATPAPGVRADAPATTVSEIVITAPRKGGPASTPVTPGAVGPTVAPAAPPPQPTTPAKAAPDGDAPSGPEALAAIIDAMIDAALERKKKDAGQD